MVIKDFEKKLLSLIKSGKYFLHFFPRKDLMEATTTTTMATTMRTMTTLGGTTSTTILAIIAKGIHIDFILLLFKVKST